MTNPKAAAHSLLLDHSIDGTFRDESDIQIAKYHVEQTINFTLNILNDTSTIEEKRQLIADINNELPKFKAKEK